MLVKADFHIHTSEDKEDSFIKYSAKEMIDEASRKGFNVISFTLHRKVFDIENLKDYAKKKGIVLIRGVEAKIEEKHVLIYNITADEHSKLESFEDLRILKRKNKDIFVIAPHPFMFRSPITKNCIQEKYSQNKDLFDALEIQQFYSFFMNSNRKTIKIAKMDGKPLIANSDSHFLRYFGRHYTFVDVNGHLNEKNLFKAIKEGKTRIVSNMNFFVFCSMLFNFLVHSVKKEHFRS